MEKQLSPDFTCRYDKYYRWMKFDANLAILSLLNAFFVTTLSSVTSKTNAFMFASGNPTFLRNKRGFKQ